MTNPQANWTFDGDGADFRLAQEAARLQLSHVFDPMSALHTAVIDPLPHQIIAVYENMLPRQPLRYLLADDPGAGKTIMAGLLICEMSLRGDVKRCLVCAPGSLSEQWQDELRDKFQLDFAILDSDLIARSDKPFAETERLIIRLDQVSRSADLLAQLRETRWDLVICDEAHKMAASYAGKRAHETKRYQLGRLLGGITRHLLLMTATPHNGKADDFQLFMQLLDEDRFAGPADADAPPDDISDLMRRMTKESLLKFNGDPLFPERRANTVDYQLSVAESELYEGVTDYVRRQFDRAEQIQHGGRRSAIGFALTILQRRLASSPAALYHSLQRRRQRLQARLDADDPRAYRLPMPATLQDEELLHSLDDLPDQQADELESQLLSHASAAQTRAELAAEIRTLQRLAAQARRILHGDSDRKLEQLLSLINDTPQMRRPDGELRKLVIFTEHKDTLDYLVDKLRHAVGLGDAVVTIHGGIPRAQRRLTETRFREDKSAQILVATDAAGEGINLQRAHLMVNYDLPWNPNRLEQRFGRIHRIGQKQVCHLWNLVAGETREGAVYQRLLEKLETEREQLGGQVFDVLGELFNETPLRDLLIEALRYGDDPARQQLLFQRLDQDATAASARQQQKQRQLASALLDDEALVNLRREKERRHAERLQPHYVGDFFVQAFERLGGALHRREPGRYHIRRTPGCLRGQPGVAASYPRLCFDKQRLHKEPPAQLLSPSHPLFAAVADAVLRQHGHALQRGATLIDRSDSASQPRVLLAIDCALHDAERDIARQLHFIELHADGAIQPAGSAPHLDYAPASPAERQAAAKLLQEDWLQAQQLHARAQDYAETRLLPPLFQRIQRERIKRLDKTEAAVKARLRRAIQRWKREGVRLREAEKAGKPSKGMSSRQAFEHAGQLSERRSQRLAEIRRQRQIHAAPPRIRSAALILPQGFFPSSQRVIDTRASEMLAMRAVMQAEKNLGNAPEDVSEQKRGYDILSQPADPHAPARHIEVKGRRADAATVALTYNEINSARNDADNFILAIALIADGAVTKLRYVRKFPFYEPDPHSISVNFDLKDLLARGHPPS